MTIITKSTANLSFLKIKENHELKINKYIKCSERLDSISNAIHMCVCMWDWKNIFLS